MHRSNATQSQGDALTRHRQDRIEQAKFCDHDNQNHPKGPQKSLKSTDRITGPNHWTEKRIESAKWAGQQHFAYHNDEPTSTAGFINDDDQPHGSTSPTITEISFNTPWETAARDPLNQKNSTKPLNGGLAILQTRWPETLEAIGVVKTYAEVMTVRSPVCFGHGWPRQERPQAHQSLRARQGGERRSTLSPHCQHDRTARESPVLVIR